MSSAIRLQRSALVATLATIGTLVTVSSGAQAACYAGNTGLDGHRLASANKSGVFKSKAQERARGSWNDRAQSLMGTSRANWGNAQNRDYYCHHAFVWHCTAYARPCA